ncbi:hypothetical protein SAMN05421759_13011 [Roseivivax lentus]|uniref:Uncharacterized protein n=2 Tax=Roseivivax lentus TaxID=633194 RepID=A0A1N7Q6J1_9RHOB|nr:helix-turn-helix transcriptional regulator [Roseivivax lentus]SIT18463.1 hypothetical protein SAMN05421759_13011 [Roseivivax lentus]
MPIDWAQLGKDTDRKILERGVSSEWVANKAGVDRKTVDRLRKGMVVRPVSLKSIADVLSLRISDQFEGNRASRATPVDAFAPIHLGGYGKAHFEPYIGHYYLFRNSYDYDDRVICSAFEIFWDDSASHLKWRDKQVNKRDDGKTFSYEFEGSVSIPPGTSVTQFIGDTGKGFTRLITATALRGGPPPHFKGILLGINEDSRFGYYPVTSPVYVERCKGQPDMRELARCVGSHPKDRVWHEGARDELRLISKSYGSFSKRAFDPS